MSENPKKKSSFILCCVVCGNQSKKEICSERCKEWADFYHNVFPKDNLSSITGFPRKKTVKSTVKTESFVGSGKID